MMLLNPAAGSKRGSLENAAASASVCADGSVSINAAAAETSMVVFTAAILSEMLKLIGTGLATSTCSFFTLNPGAVTANSYMFGGILLNRNAPVSLVITVWLKPVDALRRCASAFGTAMW